MLPLYHILLLISSDWLGPEAGTGHFCALAEGKRALLPLVLGDRANRVVVERRRETKTEREREGGEGVKVEEGGEKKEDERKRKRGRRRSIPVSFIAQCLPGFCIIHERKLEAQRQFRTTLSISV